MVMRKRKSGKRRPTQRRKAVRSKRVRKNNVVTTVPNGIAQRYRCATLWTLSSVYVVNAASVAEIYIQSSTNDPGGSIAASQPFYRDQLASLYTRYRVKAMKVYLTMSNQNGNRDVDIACWWAANLTPVSTWAQASSQPGSIVRVLPLDRSTARISSYRPMYKVLGTAHNMYDTDLNYQATCGNDPTSMGYFRVFISNALSADTQASLHISFRVRYYVEYFQPVLTVDA